MRARSILFGVATALAIAPPALGQDALIYETCLVEASEEEAIVAAFEADGWTLLTDPDDQVAARHAAGEIAHVPIFLPGPIEGMAGARGFAERAHSWGEQTFAEALLFERDDAIAAVADARMLPGIVDRLCVMAGRAFPVLEDLIAELPESETADQLAASLWAIEDDFPRFVTAVRIEAGALAQMVLSGRVGLIVQTRFESAQ